MALNDGNAESPDAAFMFKEWLLDFSADRMLKEEMEDQARPIHYTGERRLFYELLRDALESFVKESKPKKLPEHENKTTMRLMRYEEIRRWIFEEPDEPGWPFTFENCCDAVGLDPDYLRRIVKRVAITNYRPVARQALFNGSKTGRISNKHRKMIKQAV